MKIISLIFFTLLSYNLLCQTTFYDDKTSLYGIIDSQGNIILQPTYKYISRIQNGFCLYSENLENGPFGVLNQFGKIIIKPIFQSECEVNLNKAQFDLIINEKEVINEWGNYVKTKYVFYDSNGKIVFNCPDEWKWISGFCNNIAIISRGENRLGEFNLINSKGEILSDKWFDDVNQINRIHYGIDENRIYKEDGTHYIEQERHVFYKINLEKNIQIVDKSINILKLSKEIPPFCHFQCCDMDVVHLKKVDNTLPYRYTDFQTNIFSNLYYGDEIIYNKKIDRALVIDSLYNVHLINAKGEIISNISSKIPRLKSIISNDIYHKHEILNSLELIYNGLFVIDENDKFYLMDINGNTIKVMAEYPALIDCSSDGDNH